MRQMLLISFRLCALIILLIGLGLLWFRRSSPESIWIAYVVDDGYGSRLRWIDFNGRQMPELNQTGGGYFSPSWSADGKLLYYVQRANGIEMPLAHDIARNSSSIITRPLAPARLRTNVSPDGAWFLSLRHQADNWEIFRIRVDGSERENITQHPADDGYAAWSASGEWIIFASDRGGTWDIFRVRSDGRDLRQLSFSPANAWQPAPSPALEKAFYLWKLIAFSGMLEVVRLFISRFKL